MQQQRKNSFLLIKRLVFGDLLFVILWGMVACTQDVAPPVRQVNIAHNVKFLLLPPESFKQSLSVLQSLEVQYERETQKMLAQLEITPKKMTFVGLSPMGNRLFTMLWTGQNFSDEYLLKNIKDEWPFPFEPKRILADVQLALWPNIPTQNGIKIRETALPNMSREILRSDLNEYPIMRITYETRPFWQGLIVIEHLERNYQLSIETLQINRLP